MNRRVNDAPARADSSPPANPPDVAEGAALPLSNALLGTWSDVDNSDEEVTFAIVRLTNGTVLVAGAEPEAASFTLAQLTTNAVSLRHDGGETTEMVLTYRVDGVEGVHSLSIAVTPVNDAPVGALAIDGTLSGPQIALPEKVGPLQGATASTVGGTANNPIPFRLAADPDTDDNRDGLKLVIDLPRFFMTMPDGDLSPSARQNLDYEIAKQNDNDTDFSENYADQTQFGDYGVFELTEAGTYRFAVTGTDGTHTFYVNVTFNGQVTHLLGS